MPHRAVDITNLTHRYGTLAALRDVCLEVPEGILFGLLGPNGGGKTTLFRILSTLLRPTEGRALVRGVDVVQAPRKVRQSLGIIFQDVALDDELRVSENLLAHASLHGIARKAARERIDDLLSLMDLSGRENDRVGRLSGGLKRRVDLVRGLLHAPPVLLLDEPTAGLDPAARVTFWEILQRVRRQEGITILLATHFMTEADRCDQLAIIDDGRVVASGSPGGLKSSIGEETLWIEADDPRALARIIHAQSGLSARIIGSRLQISDPHAHELLPSLYDLHGENIRSATVRRPTLEDVFMVHAGHAIETSVVNETPAEVE